MQSQSSLKYFSSSLISLLVCSCSFGNQNPLNCAAPHVDNRINQCTIVAQASDFGQCLSASEIPEHSCIVMDKDLSFCDGNEAINFSAVFTTSSKTLNCKGGTIDHGWSQHSSANITPTKRHKQMPFVRFLDDHSLENITVKNCTMRGTFHAGIQMTRFFGGELGGDGKLDTTETLPIGHKNVLLQDIKLEGSEVGIYLGNFSENITINRVHIDGTRRIGIYSESGSHKIKITHSVISNNKTREAIAVDSTYNSEISNTQFLNNLEGGINVYQNCGERKGSVCPVIRSTPPNNNRILNNTFIGNGISGIQIASRQGRKHSLGWCESLHGLPGKFIDTSENNIVSGNRIECQEGTALVVMDGPNEISNNVVVAEGGCVPLEVSTGGFRFFNKNVLEDILLEGNTIQSEHQPVFRNVREGVIIKSE